MMFLTKCNHCKNNMKYHTRDTILDNKKKKCVYCNKTFKIRENIIKKID